MKCFVRILFVVIGSLWLTGTVSAGNFSVDKALSEVAVDCRASPPHEFTSVVTVYEYDIEIDSKTLEVKHANFGFKIADMDSNSGSRDKKMRGWIDVDSFPKASFTLKEVEHSGEKWIGRGAFEMHGVSREIEIPFSVKREGDLVVLEGSLVFDYQDWDLDLVKLLFFKVNKDINPRFHLVGALEK